MTPRMDVSMLTNLLIKIFGQDVWDDSAERTADRWLRAMAEFRPETKIDFKFTTFKAEVNQLIVVRNIEFASLCAHHLFPFQGRVHVGYLPNRLQVGLSKIPRLVHHFAKRPTVQETLTAQIATYLKDKLEAQGVAVIIEAQHTCMSCRGIREHNAEMITSEMKGTFLTSSAARSEFLRAVGLS